MKISNSYPPNYEQIVAKFDIKGRVGIIFTYGDTIYNPSQTDIPPDLVAHEETHEKQQIWAGGPDKWWDKYIADPEFRFEQELAAYRAQYKYACLVYGREERRRLLKHISSALAGPMYGNLMSQAQAKVAITS